MITRELKVLVVSLDPDNNEKYDQQTASFCRDIFELSRGLYRYNIVERQDIYEPTYPTLKLLQEYPIVERVNARTLDEVWVMSPQGVENCMGGNDPFYLGAAPLQLSGYRRFPIMRTSGDLLYAFVRRFEHIMYQVYRDYPPSKNHWLHFIREEFHNPGHASCGVSLRPPTGNMLEYNTLMSVLSDCEDWETYPQLRGRVQYINSTNWGSTMEGFLKWWLKHVPHGIKKTDGIHDNWWHYVMNLDLVK